MPSGKLLERFWDERRASVRIACPPGLVPAPGQYLLACDPASDSPLAVPIFSAGLTLDGFLAASPLPRAWPPGLTLSLRGPLGHGFHLPAAARKVALLALEERPASLLSLLAPALAQNASVALVCDTPPDDLPADVEVQPLAALPEVYAWADFLAAHAARESLPTLRTMLGAGEQFKVTREAQVLVDTPIPCGGLAECGVCAVKVKGGFKLVCKDGPVFPLFTLLE